MKKHSGFTLIELMVVMAIIAILATAGLTAYSNYLKKARDSARLQTARQLMTKVEELANGGRLPSASELVTFLESENFAPVKNDNGYGLGLGKLDMDPLHGAANCLADSAIMYEMMSSSSSTAPCVFSYIKFVDGTYAIGYGIEHPDSPNSFWYASTYYETNYNGPTAVFGNFIGTNAALSAGSSTLQNLYQQQPSWSSGPIIVNIDDAAIISYVSPSLATM